MMDKKDAITTLDMLKQEVRKFRTDREWQPFHTPKELAIDITVEASELLELFLWKSADEIREKIAHDAHYKERIGEELADVFHACLGFADILDIDVTNVFLDKLAKTAAKYPIEISRGVNKKYTEF